MTIFPTFYKTSETCSEARHVWFTDAIPPAPNMKCECGAKTWSQYWEEAAQKQLKFEFRKPVSEG